MINKSCYLFNVLFFLCISCSPPEVLNNSYETKYENSKENYVLNCNYELQNNIHFPFGNVKYCIVKQKNSFQRIKIENQNTKNLLQILNDTSNYQWGEIGTFILGFWIEFYDENNNLIGLTEIDVDKFQTYSKPHLAKMKWGMLTEVGKEKIEQILQNEF